VVNIGIFRTGLAFGRALGSMFDFCIAMEGRDLEHGHVRYPMEMAFQDVGIKT
jgi:hypothetical protein